MSEKGTLEEQEALGLRRPRPNIIQPVQPLRGEVLPPVRSVPNVVDPYAQSMPVTVQQVAKYDADPITRAQAMTMKSHQITVALAILTAAGMVILRHEFYFLVWLLLASIEWIGTFITLAILDYRETPSAANRHQMDAYIKMMDREQRNRLKAMYGEDYIE